jgi:hypothetical protein
MFGPTLPFKSEALTSEPFLFNRTSPALVGVKEHFICFTATFKALLLSNYQKHLAQKHLTEKHFAREHFYLKVIIVQGE